MTTVRELLRRNRRTSALVAAVVVVVAIVAVLFLRDGDERGSTVIGNPAPLGSSGGSQTEGSANTGKAAGSHRARTGGSFARLPAGAAMPTLKSLDLPGLPGRGFSVSLPKVPIVLHVTSSAPIGTIGYLVPTSPDKYYGVVKKVGRSWTLRTYGYGKPDYARLRPVRSDGRRDHLHGRGEGPRHRPPVHLRSVRPDDVPGMSRA